MDKLEPQEYRNYATELVDHYSRLRYEQDKDQEFYDDAFPVKIAAAYSTVRTGSAAKMVDAQSDYINTAKIVVTRTPKRTGRPAEEAAEKVSALLMSIVDKFHKAITESAKNVPLRGESFYQVQYVADTDGIPVIISSPDPMNVNADPQESYDGVPSRLIKSGEMTVGMVRAIYPEWPVPQGYKNTKQVKYLAYWDKDWRYIEADEISCFTDGVHKNMAGVVPFTHCASGLGKDSPDGKPEDKYVGKIRKFRGLLTEQCEVRSRLASGIALWANPYGVFSILEDGIEIEDLVKKVNLSPGHNITIPKGVAFEVKGGTAPPREIFAYLADIDSRLDLETPPVTSGSPSSPDASGRQEDIYTAAFRKKPEQIERNLERALETALGHVLMILDTTPGALPRTIVTLEYADGKHTQKEVKVTKADIGGYYGCKVEFRPDEEMAQGRKLMMARALYDSPSGHLITHKRLLVDGYGMTEAEASDEIIDVRVEKVVNENVVIANIVAEEAMAGLGMDRAIAESKKAGIPLMETGLNPSRGGQPRTFTGNPQSKDAVRQMMGQEAGGQIRRPPASTGG